MIVKSVNKVELNWKQKIIKSNFIINCILFLKKTKPSILGGLSLYKLLKIYVKNIAKGNLSMRSSSIAFSFFMALFPFALFILNLVPYIPIDKFEEDFLQFVSESVPPNTYGAIENIINDILNNKHSGLLSSGFILSIFLMANGINAVLSSFEHSEHILHKRTFLSQYFVALGMSLFFSVLLFFTVTMIVISEIFIQITKIQDVFSDRISFIQISQFVFLGLMILLFTSILFRFGTIQKHKPPFLSVGSVFTTLLIIISSYFFGIWVVKFSKYNELYGSIGTLLIMMFYIWINCMVLLLGFELNIIINDYKKKLSSQK